MIAQGSIEFNVLINRSEYDRLKEKPLEGILKFDCTHWTNGIKKDVVLKLRYHPSCKESIYVSTLPRGSHLIDGTATELVISLPDYHYGELGRRKMTSDRWAGGGGKVTLYLSESSNWANFWCNDVYNIR
jgi:hypothetical protein